jgi:hypothetical protein
LKIFLDQIKLNDMKKLLFVCTMFLALAGFSFAQAPATATKPAPVAKPAVVKETPAKPAATSSAGNGSVVLKKDGTADKRYKNKPAAGGPVKKDGTPDKRFKANKKN